MSSQQEVLPRVHQKNFQSIGIITPYRDQVTAIRKQLGDTYEVDTVHKFQGPGTGCHHSDLG